MSTDTSNKIQITVNGQKKIVENYEVTYEDSENMFKSIRYSNGVYPSYVDLDYEDQIVTIENDWIVEINEKLIKMMLDGLKEINVKKVDGMTVIVDNFFHFKSGTLLPDVVLFVQGLGRTIRK